MESKAKISYMLGLDIGVHVLCLSADILSRSHKYFISVYVHEMCHIWREINYPQTRNHGHDENG